MRRPRIPDELAELIDERRGLVPFDAYVRDVLRRHVEPGGTSGSREPRRPAPTSGSGGARVEFGTTSQATKVPQSGGWNRAQRLGT